MQGQARSKNDTSSLPHGLYEEILTTLRRRQLDGTAVQVGRRALDSGESYAALADYLRHVIANVFDGLDAQDKLGQQIELCHRIIKLLHDLHPEIVEIASAVTRPGELLLSIVNGDHATERLAQPRPDTPLAFGCLLTGTRLDPSLVSQIKKEIRTADRVDILCSFIKWSGLRIIEDDLAALLAHPGTQLRVITTSYMGATDLRAIERLAALPNTQVRVSYDTHRTRLHAKAYTFHRMTGFGSAYVGSANLSQAAMTDGLEWTVKISQHETPHVWQKIAATFDTYWNDAEFVRYGDEDRSRLQAALKQERTGATGGESRYVFDLRPFGFQAEILERLSAERNVQRRNRHLIVAATGTGKTMITAFDYRTWCTETSPANRRRPRLLFVAHREEILRQSLYAYRAVLRDHNFGDLLVGGRQPAQLDHLFVSIQSYNSRALNSVAPDHYDYVVVDEFHHAAAASYEELLRHVRPKVLLGLTATPERTDNLDILRHFGGHISAEIRLPDAINRKLLSAFQYFGITDAVDLSDVRWQRGGYDVGELDRKLTGNDIRARLVIDKVRARLLDPRLARGLGFCVSIAHANYMAELFRRAGIPAEALSADSPPEQRRTVQDRLVRREINFIFAVDLYNEGIDIPEVDTVLFLRPTESLTVYLQQLGRGLRLCDGKDCLTVLDFVGQAHRNFRWDLRFCALLADREKSLVDQIEDEFTRLPAGCTIQLERQARQYVLENVRRAVRQSRDTLIAELTSYAEGLGRAPSLKQFMEFFKLDLDDVYRRTSWSRLCADAGVRDGFADPDEAALTKGLRRIQHTGSAEQIQRLLAVLTRDSLQIDQDDPLLSRMLTMLHLSLWPADRRPATIEEGQRRLRQNPTLKSELAELLRYKLEQISSAPPQLRLHFPCPLTPHALYTRDEILAGLGHWTLESRPQMREGVLHLAAIQVDAFFVTLDKTEKDYSPTTMYRDYAINNRLFHWQSQNTTSVESPTGLRYIHHTDHGHTILLFVREHKRTNDLAAPYYFLGPADYESHDGNRPINIVWRLRHPMPALLLRRTARLITA